MNSLDEIDIQIAPGEDTEQAVTANVMAILHEIGRMLDELLEKDVSDSIDLRSLPLLAGEYEALKVILGEGELSISFNNLGQSKIHETALSGVWWLSHDDENGERLSEFIEVTQIPDIIKSDRSEITFARTALKQQLADWAEQQSVNDV